ncbi:hypothetical protein DVJ83_05565 [Deinococcus wulumuqiensis]|uniref:ATPase AAA-type core domain-containing protein n=1 Tax=Deinococcus wulumuqiensis TaxID=980427 RepID=A0A345IG95_9DEIO|nr:ATP-binding protein [Deinococcus wulumuqiensis]AXG98717.1 hypothetical protein DVJ83_05565 [Deinococcus wulumuqiensis]
MKNTKKFSIKLRNLKSFRTLEFSPQGLTVIIGANASGKSNLLDSFKILSSIGKDRNLRSLFGSSEHNPIKIRGSLPQLFRRGSKKVTISISFKEKFLLPRRNATQETLNSTTYTITLSTSVGSEINIDEVIEVRSSGKKYKFNARDSYTKFSEIFNVKTDLHSGQFVIQRTSKLNRAFIESANQMAQEIEKRVKSNEPLNDLGPRLESISNLGVFLFSVNAINDKLNQINFIEPEPNKMRSYDSLGEDQISFDGSKISSALYSICALGQEGTILSWASRISNCEFTKIEFDEDINGDIIALLREGSGVSTPLSSASDGTLRFLAILVKLVQVAENSILFIEEIENGIHPSRVFTIMEMIREFSESKKLTCCVTTHSPVSLLYMLKINDLKNTEIIYKDDKSGESKIYSVNEIENLRNILSNNSITEIFLDGWLEDAIYFSESK